MTETTEATRTGPAPRQVATYAAAAGVLGLCVVWAYRSMRAVMDVGGACADGGPYVSAQPCPDGAFLIAIAIPVMMITAFVGTVVGTSLEAPDLLLPMWFLVFVGLGWNFLDLGLLQGDLVAGWIVCGVMFWLMGWPALFAILPVGPSKGFAPVRRLPVSTSRQWSLVLVLMIAVGGAVGWVTWTAISY